MVPQAHLLLRWCPGKPYQTMYVGVAIIMRAALEFYNRGNRGDMQSRVRGPSINLTGLRGCQVHEHMFWSMILKGRVSRCTYTAMVPPSPTRAPECWALAKQLGRVHLFICMWQLGVFLSRQWSVQPHTCKKKGWGYKGAVGWGGVTLQPSTPIRLSASPLPEEISLTVPSSWQARGRGGGGTGDRERECVST